ncbi:GGDEF domain-containing protein [Lysobacter sp. D1-1-M9]|uniref:GGDEF domain-containing protein n=1 Tax=Novilysobacter longmucuonensis TaxID=3098603 RepID=UPI002FCA1860
MHTNERSLRERVTALLARPDEIMLEAGAGGELLVARLRAVIAALLLLLPLANALAGGSISDTLVGLAATVLINVFAQAWLMLARRRRRFLWLPFATAAFDVTATSVVLLLLAWDQLPAGTNSMVVWCGYVLAILLTALRNDGRTTLFAGLLAIMQYGALVLAIFASATSPEQLISSDYGSVTASAQVQRMVLLAIVTVITAMVVYRLQRLVEMSGSDGLTGLPNRTWLLHRMPRLFDAARHDGDSLTLALINLDHFRRINSEIGNRAADRALCQVVAVIGELTDEREWLVRLRGEEFVLVLRKPLGTAWERVDALRRLVAERAFEPERGAESIRLSFSAGLVSYPHDGQDLSRLLRCADQRLQMAKRDGRNRVVARES